MPKEIPKIREYNIGNFKEKLDKLDKAKENGKKITFNAGIADTLLSAMMSTNSAELTIVEALVLNGLVTNERKELLTSILRNSRNIAFIFLDQLLESIDEEDDK